jgi:hypothetical protein
MKIGFKILVNFVLYLLIFIVFNISAVLFYLSGKEKNIPPQIISLIEDVIESSNTKLEFYVAAADAQFTSFSEGISITLNDSYMQFGDSVSASIPETKLQISLKDLLILRPTLNYMRLYNPQFILTSTDESDDVIDISSEDSFINLYKNILYGFFDAVDKRNNIIPIKQVDMEEAAFSINRSGNYENWKLNKAGMRFFKLQDSTYLRTELSTSLLGYESNIIADARLLEDEKIIAEVSLDKIPAEFIADFYDNLNWLSKVRTLFSGRSVIILDKALKSTSISAETKLSFKERGMNETNIAVYAVLNLSVSEENDQKLIPNINSRVTINKLKMNDLSKLWPEELAPLTRKDIMGKFSNGIYEKALINLTYKFSDTKFSEIIEEKLVVEGKVKNADINFNKKYPNIYEADGNFEYGIDYVESYLQKAKFSNMDFSNVNMRIDGLETESNFMEISGNFSGQLMNIKELVTAAMNGRDKDFYYNQKEIDAVGRGSFYYKDDIFDAFTEDYTQLLIKYEIDELKIKDVYENIDFASTEPASLVVNEDGLQIKTRGNIGQESQINGEVNVGFHKSNDLEITAEGNLSSKDIGLIIEDFPKYANGYVDAKVNYNSVGSINSFSAYLDLIKSDIYIPYISFNKSIDEFASLSLYGRHSGQKAIIFKKIELITDSSKSSGNAIVSLDGKVADEIYFKNLRTGLNDTELYYSVAPEIRKKVSGVEKIIRPRTYVVKINGEKFDAKELLSSEGEKMKSSSADKIAKNTDKIKDNNNESIFKAFKDAKIFTNINLKELYLAADIIMENVKGELNCGIDDCFNAFLTGNFVEGGNLNMTLQAENDSEPDGTRDLKIATDNFGSLIKGLGFKASISGGSARVSAVIDDNDNNKTIGEIKASNFKIEKAPILTRILSLASITGLAELLTGQGVNMSEMNGDFYIDGDYFVISELYATGNSLGLTSQGNLNLINNQINLSGAVTPSYSVNSFFGKIPLLGRVLTSNKGEGIIATSYKVQGNASDPDISVNPLSAFTPGFLRNIWGNANTNPNKTNKNKRNARNSRN